jgi:iron complex outermembrane receptor protein
MGGVINIITKTPQKLELEASGGYGTDDTYRYRFSAGDLLWNRLSVKVGYEEESTGGYASTPVVQSITSGTGNVSGGYAMNDMLGEATRWVLGDKGDNGAWRQSSSQATRSPPIRGNSAPYLLGSDDYDYGYPTYYIGHSAAIPHMPSQEKVRGTIQANTSSAIAGKQKRYRHLHPFFRRIIRPVKLTLRPGRFGWTIAILANGSNNAFYDDSPGSLKITENGSWFTEMRGDVPLGSSHLLTVGTSFRRDDSDTNDYNIPFYRSFSGAGPSTFYSGGKSTSWAVFAQDEWQILDPLTVYLGARIDSWDCLRWRNPAYPDRNPVLQQQRIGIQPQRAAVWKALPDTTVRGSVAMPSGLPRSMSSTAPGPLFHDLSEQSRPDPRNRLTYELGIDQYFFDNAPGFP